MQSFVSTLHHIIQEPRKPAGNEHPAVILLHGRGADEYDLFDLTRYLDERFFFISVRAPYPFPYGGFTWFDLPESGMPDPSILADSYHKLGTFFDEIRVNYPVNPKKIFLLGFSMGTIMSYTLALTRPHDIAGVMANSGYLPEEAPFPYQWDEAKTTPFFVAHGVQDVMLPVTLARRSKLVLEQHHVPLEYHEYPIGHQFSEESLNDMALWLTQRL